jgi:hypothetical protein
MLAETVAHLCEQHQHTGPSQGYTVQSESVRGNKEVWCLCVLCHSFSCTGERHLTQHSEQAHPGTAPKFIKLNNKGQRLICELGFVDQLSGNMRLQAVRPNVASLVKTEGAGGVRRMYLCPEANCGIKTKTLKGMEEHLRQSHVVRMQCGDCNQVIEIYFFVFNDKTRAGQLKLLAIFQGSHNHSHTIMQRCFFAAIKTHINCKKSIFPVK